MRVNYSNRKYNKATLAYRFGHAVFKPFAVYYVVILRILNFVDSNSGRELQFYFDVYLYPPYGMHPDEGKIEDENPPDSNVTTKSVRFIPSQTTV